MSKKAFFVLDFDYVTLLLSLVSLVPIASILVSGGETTIKDATFGVFLVLLPMWHIGYMIFKTFKGGNSNEVSNRKVSYSKARVPEDTRLAMLNLRACGVHRDDIAKYFRVNPIFVSRLSQTQPELVLQLSHTNQLSILKGRFDKNPTTQEAVNSAVEVLNSMYLFDRVNFIAVFGDKAQVALRSTDSLPKIVRPNYASQLTEVDDVQNVAEDDNVQDFQMEEEPLTESYSDLEEHEEVQQYAAEEKNFNVKLHQLLHKRHLHGLCLALIAQGMRRSDVANGASIHLSTISNIVERASRIDQLQEVTSLIENKVNRLKKGETYSEQNVSNFRELVDLFNDVDFNIEKALGVDTQAQEIKMSEILLKIKRDLSDVEKKKAAVTALVACGINQEHVSKLFNTSRMTVSRISSSVLHGNIELLEITGHHYKERHRDKSWTYSSETISDATEALRMFDMGDLVENFLSITAERVK